MRKLLLLPLLLTGCGQDPSPPSPPKPPSKTVRLAEVRAAVNRSFPDEERALQIRCPKLAGERFSCRALMSSGVREQIHLRRRPDRLEAESFTHLSSRPQP